MLVSTQPVKVEIPHEPGHYIEFRRLPWKLLKQARKVRADEAREEAKALGAEFIRALSAGDTASEERVRSRMEELQYHHTNFDMETLLTKGIAAWSYEGQVADGLELLDEGTAVWAMQQIITLSRPPSASEEKK
jgi:hypothetical protein